MKAKCINCAWLICHQSREICWKTGGVVELWCDRYCEHFACAPVYQIRQRHEAFPKALHSEKEN